MSPNLMGMAKDLLSDSVMDQIGGLLGENQSNTRAAVDSGLPAILGGLIGKMNEPDGADVVFKELDNHDGGILDSLGDMISGAGQSNFLKIGASLLPMLLGSRQSGVVGTLARMLGMGNSKIGTVLSVLGPIVMSLISKHRASSPGFNAGNLKQLLFDQKDHLAGATPGELRTSLGLGEFFADGSKPAVAAVAPAAAEPVKEASSGGGFGRILPWLALALAGFLGWNWLSGSGDTEVKTPAISAPEVPEVRAPDVSVPEVSMPEVSMPDVPDIGGLQDQLSGTFSKVTDSLTGITDLSSAQEAAGSLGEAATAIDGLNLDQLPGPAKSALQPMVGGFVETAQGALETAYKIPGVQGVLEPIAGPLFEKLSAFL